MANSINTNVGSQIALQALNQTNRDLGVTQNRINTGQKVSSAKDNGAIFAIATTQRAELGALDAVKNSIQRGQSIVDVALAAGDTITAALTEQKSLAVSIASSTGAAQTAYLNDYNKLGAEITSALAGATFDGVNLFESAAQETVTTNTTGGTANIGAATPTTVATTATLAAPADAAAGQAAIAAVDTAISAFSAVLGDLGSQSKSLERSLTFTSKVQDSIEAGIGNLVDADLAKESAKLTALQTKQQLGVQALSIANQSSGILLSLFR